MTDHTERALQVNAEAEASDNAKRWAQCPTCKTLARIRKDETIRAHWTPNFPRRMGYRPCAGTGRDTTGWPVKAVRYGVAARVLSGAEITREALAQKMASVTMSDRTAQVGMTEAMVIELARIAEKRPVTLVDIAEAVDIYVSVCENHDGN